MSLYSNEVTEEPAGQVDEMDALVDEFTAAGEGGIGTPFLLVAQPATVAVAGAEEEQRAK